MVATDDRKEVLNKLARLVPTGSTARRRSAGGILSGVLFVWGAKFYGELGSASIIWGMIRRRDFLSSKTSATGWPAKRVLAFILTLSLAGL